MRQFFLGVLIAALGAGFLATEAVAKRLGGGGSSGMKRAVPTQRTPPQNAPPQQQPQQAGQQAAAPGVAGAAPAPARRSWLGPVAGLAAGLGIAALFSHFGMGEGLANMVTLLLVAVVAFLAIRFVMRRLRPQRALAGAGAGAGAGARTGIEPRIEPMARTFDGAASNAAPEAASPGAQAVALPPNFDVAAFERAAKLIFIRMQAANDAADLDDLRRFTTPEMFAAARLDLQERAGARQRTDVVQLNAEVLDLAREDGRDVVSVRYHGLVREDEGGAAQPFDEVWHLVRPSDGGADWTLAGIAQIA